jgi:hypothetical protein
MVRHQLASPIGSPRSGFLLSRTVLVVLQFSLPHIAVADDGQWHATTPDFRPAEYDCGELIENGSPPPVTMRRAISIGLAPAPPASTGAFFCLSEKARRIAISRFIEVTERIWPHDRCRTYRLLPPISSTANRREASVIDRDQENARSLTLLQRPLNATITQDESISSARELRATVGWWVCGWRAPIHSIRLHSDQADQS